MQNLSSFLPEDLYTEHLSDICDISFTRREIDVMACLLSARKTSKIAYFLSVDPRTVETHIRNITLKLECNTREGIIDFLETSNKVPFLRAHYSSLQNKVAFEKSLKEIAKLNLVECIIRILTNEENDSCQTSLVSLLKAHLRLAGFTIANEEKVSESEFLIYGLPQSLSDLPPAFIEKINQHPRAKVLLLLAEGKTKRELPKELKGFDTIRLTKDSNYYFYFFDIVKKIITNIKMDAIVLNFKEKYKKVGAPKSLDNSEILPKQTPHFFELIKCNMSTRQWFMSAALLVTFFVFIGFLKFYWTSEGETLKQPIVLSELSIPAAFAFLDRPELLLEIEKGFKSPRSIQTIAVVGIGGSGKTTLARQYTRQQKANIVWEINAETQESLKSSFEKLAYNLVKTEEDEKILRSIKETNSPAEREEKTLLFVQKHLRLQSRWFLIYDNVEHLGDIQKYFPQDVNTWGEGKIILTTRNTNIQNNSQIDGIILIGELSPRQKFNLFVQIMNSRSLQPFPTQKEAEAIKFLENIPSFPLDVSVAAYYLKSTDISYKKYLQYLHNNDHHFAILQENLLKEAGKYTKLRYNIITIAITKLIETHKDFGDILLLISLIDSQNIPRGLLNLYKGEAIVDNFIYHLKKYSLLCTQFSEKNPFLSVSLHRSTHAIISAFYLNQEEHENNKKSSLIYNLFLQYLTELIDNFDYAKINIMDSHCEMFLSHQKLSLNNLLKGLIEGELGYIYFYKGDYVKAKDLLKKSLTKLACYENENPLKIARVLLYSGILEREIGNYNEAKKMLERSLIIYQKHPTKNYVGLARTLSTLGNVYRSLGKYEQARDMLEQSLSIYKTYLPKNYDGEAWTLSHLANVYRELGNSKKSIELFEMSLSIYQKHLSKNFAEMAWTLTYLGNVYRDLENFKKAQEIYEESLSIYAKHFPKNHIKIAEVLVNLAIVWRKLGKFEHAKNLLKKSLSIYKSHFSNNHVDVAWTLTHLGALYCEIGDFKEAEKLLEQSLSIYQQHLPEDHCEIAWVLSHLGNTRLKLGNFEGAKNLLERCIKIYKDNLPKNDTCISTAMENLANVYGKIGKYKEAKNLLEKELLDLQHRYGMECQRIARILNTLGEIYLLENQMAPAEKLFNLSLQRLRKKNDQHSVCLVLENFSELYLKKAMQAANNGNHQHVEAFKAKAETYLQQALEVAQRHFPIDSPHISRMQTKLKNFENAFIKIDKQVH